MWIVGAAIKGDAAVFRCVQERDGRRPLEVPQWMFDAASCCRTVQAPMPLVSVTALREVRALIDAVMQAPPVTVLQAEHPIRDFPGGAHAQQDPTATGQPAKIVPAQAAPLRWTDVPVETRARAVALLARLLRQHLRAHRAAEVRDE